MLRASAGPLLSAVPLFLLPLAGAVLLDAEQFAIWSILASVSTLAVSMDFGGVAYMTTGLHRPGRRVLIWRSSWMSVGGAALIGLIAICAWIPYSSTDAAQAFSLSEGCLAIAATAVAAGGRGLTQLYAQVYLFDRRFAWRNAALFVQSGVAAGTTLLFLWLLDDAWALPLGWGVGGVAALSICAWGGLDPLRRDGDLPEELEPRPAANLQRFLWARSTATVVGGVLLQADRWVVGALGGAVVLAGYEVAWRFASLPRFLAQSLSSISGVDAAQTRARSLEELRSLLRNSIFVSGALVGVGALGTCALYAVSYRAFNQHASGSIFILLLLFQGVLGVTGVVTQVGGGLGVPTIDLQFLFGCLGFFLAGAVVGFLVNSASLFVVTYAVGSLLMCNYYFYYGPRRILE